MNVSCPDCAHAVPVAEFLAACTNYTPGVRTVTWRCPARGDRNEFRIVDGAVEIGYVYAAGTAHFAAMDEVAVAGLTVHPGADELRIALGTSNWTIRRGR